MRKNKRKLYGFETTNRAKHNLKVHLILVCKYRKRLLIGNMKEEIKNIIYEIESKSDFNIRHLAKLICIPQQNHGQS